MSSAALQHDVGWLGSEDNTQATVSEYECHCIRKENSPKSA